MPAWSEVLEARTNERGDLFVRIKPAYVESLMRQWVNYDEEVQYDIVASMLEPYGFEVAAAWHHWTFVKDAGKYKMNASDLSQLKWGYWIVIDRVEMEQWEREYYERYGGLYSGPGYLGRDMIIDEMNLQPLPKVRTSYCESINWDDDNDDDWTMFDKDNWSVFDDTDIPF